MSGVWHRWWAPAAAALALGYLTVMVVMGALPQSKQLIVYEAHGVLDMAPETVSRVTLTAKGQSAVFVRQGDGWVRERNAAPLDDALARTLDRAVKFMHTSNPVREFKAEEIGETPLADFGLAEPSLSIALEKGGSVVLEADFGNLNSDGLLQYMMTRGQGTVYMMSSFVGKEWSKVAEATLS
jgi:hypothetical protein